MRRECVEVANERARGKRGSGNVQGRVERTVISSQHLEGHRLNLCGVEMESQLRRFWIFAGYPDSGGPISSSVGPISGRPVCGCTRGPHRSNATPEIVSASCSSTPQSQGRGPRFQARFELCASPWNKLY